jgi:hypothetical protein
MSDFLVGLGIGVVIAAVVAIGIGAWLLWDVRKR